MTTRRKSLTPLFLAILIFSSVYYFLRRTTLIKYNQTQFNKFLDDKSSDKFSNVTVDPKENSIIVKGTIIKNDGKKVDFETIYPNTEEKYNYLVNQINKKSTTGLTILKPNRRSIGSILWQVFLVIAPVLLILWALSRVSGPNSKGFEFAKSRARLNKGSNTTFENIAGAKEEKEELEEIVDFLKNPVSYSRLGARIPKGVLLVGPPGTGKTLLAKAVAGEAKVPFYSISGSDFVEMFVGVGASRVRNMFKEAKKTPPCIIFIDEIDAVGRHRGSGMGGGHDEREQTLNQLLVEMDGFAKNAGIIIIAATNREDVLDPALLRPGRFDRKISVYLPDIKARNEILLLHAKNKKIDSQVNFLNIAKRTPGFSGADLENVLNEAALLSARNKKDVINTHDIDEAIDRVIGGPAKKSKKMSESDRKLIAYHEAGHAIIGLKLADAEIVQKVTIIPRGPAGGYVLMTPKEESFVQTKEQLFHKVVSYVGGRVSEEIHFGKEKITTGAVDDLKKATSIARRMIAEFGMSEKIGPIQLESNSGPVYIGLSGRLDDSKYGAEVAKHIDQEVKKLIDKAQVIAREVINKHKETVDKIAKALLEHETLTNEMITKIDKYGDPFGEEKTDKQATNS